MPGCASELKFFDLRKSLGTWIRNKELKKVRKKFWDKSQNQDLFISPKWKITVMEMSLKSSNMSKLDHQISKI